MTTVTVIGAREVAAELGRISANTVRAVSGIVEQSAAEMRDAWHSNARASAGTHGKRYAPAVQYRLTGGWGVIGAEIAPDESMPQGGMSFELGSRNQPAHLDGLRAYAALSPAVQARINAAVAFTS